MRPATPSLDEANEALARARRMRANALLAVHQRTSSWTDVVVAATRPGGEPLRKIRLHELADAHLQIPTVSLNRRFAMFRSLCGVGPNVSDASLTIEWLLDNRVCPGYRLSRWIDALEYTHEARCERIVGFPWANPTSLTQAWNGDDVTQ